jgi:hypothetical protein
MRAISGKVYIEAKYFWWEKINKIIGKVIKGG